VRSGWRACCRFLAACEKGVRPILGTAARIVVGIRPILGTVARIVVGKVTRTAATDAMKKARPVVRIAVRVYRRPAPVSWVN